MFQSGMATLAAQCPEDEELQESASFQRSVGARHLLDDEARRAIPEAKPLDAETAARPAQYVAPEAEGSGLIEANDETGLSPDVRSLPAPWMERASLHALQEWEGYVVAIRDKEFQARLLDLTAEAAFPDEEATILLEEISDRDAAMMRVGSIFRWVIGYERSPAGAKKRVSLIVFRDLPRLTEADVRRGAEWASEVAQRFRS